MRKFLAVLRLAINDAIIYRNDMLLWAVGLAITPIISLVAWLAVISSGGKGTPLTEMEFVQYYLLIMFVRLWSNAWNSTFIAADIRSGAISPFLIKPLSYLLYRFGDSIGNRLIKGIFGVIVISILFILFQAKIPDVSLGIWLVFGISLTIAGLLLSLIDIVIGLLAFWMDDVSSIDEITDVLFGTLSGIIVPIVVFPALVQQILVFLPFKYVFSFPVEILLQKAQGNNLVIGLVMQIFWLLAFFGLYQFLWSKGQKRYQAFGA